MIRPQPARSRALDPEPPAPKPPAPAALAPGAPDAAPPAWLLLLAAVVAGELLPEVAATIP